MADMVRLPDGSLIMMGRPKPATPPGVLDRLKAGLARILPQRFDPKPAPWWIAQPQGAAPAPPPIPANVVAGKLNPFAEVEAESARQEAIAGELGDFSRRVMASPQLIQGKWFSAPVPK